MGRSHTDTDRDRGRTHLGRFGRTTLLFVIALVAGFANISLPDDAVADAIDPAPPARITSVGKDARIGVHLDAIRPDPTWTRWARRNGPNARKVLPPGGIAICAFVKQLDCDGLVHPSPPAFDGKPHERVVHTNRLLLTRRGWVDCARARCAVVISREIGVSGDAHSVGSDSERIAVLPYRLPAETPAMKKPTLTIAPSGPVHVGDTLTVTLHDPPANVAPNRRLFVGQCATKDIRRINDCGRSFADVDGTTKWTKLSGGALRQGWKVVGCGDPAGCFLAVEPPAIGWPAVAQTARFAVNA